MTAGNASVEPLFAHNARLWLRVWVATQVAAVAVALYTIVDRAGGVRAFLDGPAAAPMLGGLALVAGYYAVGVRAYPWIMHRRWAVLTFVPLGWALALSVARMSPGFGVLMLGAILQGFIFLPFAWAIATLAAATFGLAGLVAWRSPMGLSGVALQQVGSIMAAGITTGTVLLYIHRANLEAVVRTRMLRQLDEAQHDLADRAREAGVHEERQRFARDIHDTLAQGFTSVIKHLEAIELSLQASGTNGDAPPTSVMPHLAHAQAVSRASLAEIRRLVWALQPAELSETTLAAALARIVAQWGDANGVVATFTADTLPAFRPDADVIFLRAAQESLSNVARHANAKHVSVSLTSVDGLALLTIEDDGRGFAPGDANAAEQMGLSGMRGRVRPVGGHLLVESKPGAGTSITVAMPLTSIAAKEPFA